MNSRLAVGPKAHLSEKGIQKDKRLTMIKKPPTHNPVALYHSSLAYGCGSSSPPSPAPTPTPTQAVNPHWPQKWNYIHVDPTSDAGVAKAIDLFKSIRGCRLHSSGHAEGATPRHGPGRSADEPRLYRPREQNSRRGG